MVAQPNAVVSNLPSERERQAKEGLKDGHGVPPGSGLPVWCNARACRRATGDQPPAVR